MEEIFTFKGQNEIEFHKKFGTKEACLQYLADRKWKNGFICPSCGSKEEYFTSEPFHKRCKKCLHHASPMANTLFHKLKFGIEKAFLIIFKMSATTKSISAEQLAKTIGVNRKTALAFQHKVRLAMQSSEQYPMEGEVEVDEAFIGGQEESENRGRGAESKTQIVLAVEKTGLFGIKRVYARVIENGSTSELMTIFEKHISKTAKVLTDKWKGYLPIMNSYNIVQEKSLPKENFQTMHQCIQQLKGWIRGIHHHVSPEYLQAYLNEFCYRINRSIYKESIFDNLLNRMALASPCYLNNLKKNYWK
jgi:transposase-like protein